MLLHVRPTGGWWLLPSWLTLPVAAGYVTPLGYVRWRPVALLWVHLTAGTCMMADSYSQVEQASNVRALKLLLTGASERAHAVFATDPREYARSMDEVRGIIGQLANALAVEELSRARTASEGVSFPASAVQLH